MSDYYNISIIGSGNIAWHLAPAMENAGHQIHEVFSKNSSHAAQLVQRLYSAEINESLDFSGSPSEIFIIAVSDDAIEEVASNITLPNADALLLHTSGSVSIEVLAHYATNYGVFYPLQSFVKKRKLVLEEIPFLLEASNKHAKSLISNLANSLSNNVLWLKGDKRQSLHLSAIFASNFTNHLLTIAKTITEKDKIPFKLLEPLIVETINKALEIGPEKAQTGPAARGDLKTLDKHLHLLQNNAPMQEIYKVLSQHLLDQHYYEK